MTDHDHPSNNRIRVLAIMWKLCIYEPSWSLQMIGVTMLVARGHKAQLLCIYESCFWLELVFIEHAFLSFSFFVIVICSTWDVDHYLCSTVKWSWCRFLISFYKYIFFLDHIYENRGGEVMISQHITFFIFNWVVMTLFDAGICIKNSSIIIICFLIFWPQKK